MLPSEPERYHPYDHHQQLAYAIKSSLYSGDRDPAVRLEVPFDKLIYRGGLMSAGRLLEVVRGEEHYGIAKHQDLLPCLGKHWFICGINAHLNLILCCPCRHSPIPSLQEYFDC